jgi:RNase H-fold protein (predicted Holliday junction resolvase)
MAKKKRERINKLVEKISLFVVKNPKNKTKESDITKKEILKFKSKMKKRERKVENKKKILNNPFEAENKIKNMGKRQTKRRDREF